MTSAPEGRGLPPLSKSFDLNGVNLVEMPYIIWLKPTARAPGADANQDDKIGRTQMTRILKALFTLVLFAFIGLVAYAYLGDLEPVQRDMSQPVDLDVGQ